MRLSLLALCFALPALYAQAPASSLSDALTAARFPLQVTEKGFAGPGAPVLTAALDSAKFVAVGEDHFTREVPQFTAAVCDEMAPHGLTALAVEASPAAACFVQDSFGKRDRLARMTALQKQFPDSVVLLNSRQEDDLAAHCASAAKEDFQLWGLDQEFVGSAGWILSRMLAAKPGLQARAAILKMQGDERTDEAEATRTGDANRLYLLAVTDAQITAAQGAVEADGGAQVQQAFRDLTESRAIYREHAVDSPSSQAHRTRVLKQNFLARYRAKGGETQRVLIKFGGDHIYRGFNINHQRDLGNFLAELGDVSDGPSLHILVLGIEGTHGFYGGYRRPWRSETFDIRSAALGNGYDWAALPAKLAVSDSWTLYDLRKLRFGKVADLSPEWERAVYGYDLLVLAPHSTAADVLQ